MASSITEQLAQVEQQIADLTAEYNRYSAEFNSNYSYIGTAEAYAHPRAIQLQQLREQTLARIKEAEKVRARLQAEQSTYNAGLAEAAALGLTGHAAELAAQGKVEAEKTKRNIYTIAGIGLLIVLLVVAVIWYRKRKR